MILPWRKNTAAAPFVREFANVAVWSGRREAHEPDSPQFLLFVNHYNLYVDPDDLLKKHEFEVVEYPDPLPFPYNATFFDTYSVLTSETIRTQKIFVIVAKCGDDHCRRQHVIAYCGKCEDKDAIFILASNWTGKEEYREMCIALLNFCAGVCSFDAKVCLSDAAPQYESLLGADPELELVHIATNSIMRADVIFHSHLQKSLQVSKKTRGNHRIARGRSGGPVEFQVGPATDISELYASIRALNDIFRAVFDDFALTLSERVYTLECHIHFGPPKNPKLQLHEDDIRHAATRIDNAVGDLVRLSGLARPWDYLSGNFGAKWHGGFEYRSLPSAVLVNEKIFTTVIEAMLYGSPLSHNDAIFARLRLYRELGLNYSFDYAVVEGEPKFDPNHEFCRDFVKLAQKSRLPIFWSGSHRYADACSSHELAKVMGWHPLRAPNPYFVYLPLSVRTNPNEARKLFDFLHSVTGNRIR